MSLSQGPCEQQPFLALVVLGALTVTQLVCCIMGGSLQPAEG